MMDVYRDSSSEVTMRGFVSRDNLRGRIRGRGVWNRHDIRGSAILMSDRQSAPTERARRESRVK